MTDIPALPQNAARGVIRPAHPMHAYPCDHCKDIVPWNDLVLARARCALPEESTYHLHEVCADAFIQRHGERLKKIPRNSFEAGWLLY